MKKHFKVLATTLAALALFLVMAGTNALTAKAAGDTFAVKWVGGSINDWRYQVGSTFNDSADSLGIAALTYGMHEGDNVVVYPGSSTGTPALELGDKKLGSLTIYQGTTAVVKMAGANECYVLAGSTSAIYGPVKKAVVYDAATCSFANDVTDLVLNKNGALGSNLTVGGTLGRFCVTDLATGNKDYEFFDVATGAFVMTAGVNYTPDDKRKAVPSAAYNTAMGETSAPAANTSAPAADNGEYDKVPKTGDVNTVMMLVSAAAACFAGSAALRKKED